MQALITDRRALQLSLVAVLIGAALPLLGAGDAQANLRGVVLRRDGRPWAYQRIEVLPRPEDEGCIAFCDANEIQSGIITRTDAHRRYAVDPHGPVPSLHGLALTALVCRAGQEGVGVST